MTKQSQPVPPIHFAARKTQSHPWPFSPLLELPGGDLRNYGGGKVLSAQQFVLVVGLSPQHFIAVERAPGMGPIQTLLEQAVGFLWGRGARIQRVNLRCPTQWFLDANGDFLWRQCFLFFARIFLSTDPTDPPWLPSIVFPLVPISVMASAGQLHWHRVQQILEGLEASDPDLLAELGTSLAGMARRWEFYLARSILASQKVGQFHSADLSLVAECDHLLYRILTKYEPGYELLPLTTARLL
jgi:hypothetical protein